MDTGIRWQSVVDKMEGWSGDGGGVGGGQGHSRVVRVAGRCPE